MRLARDDSLVGTVVVPLVVGAVGFVAGLFVGPAWAALGFVTGTGLALAVGANVDSEESRIDELETRVAELEAERERRSDEGKTES
ncbi:hypothetical protein [Halorarius halobius]|uniref:hypothetical protein n=1 Tax=Halorarius halobius TaxID=2962671 RepID=UPI0020CBC518|nr:hypothetical protein [Halorarius halobius]